MGIRSSEARRCDMMRAVTGLQLLSEISYRGKKQLNETSLHSQYETDAAIYFSDM